MQAQRSFIAELMHRRVPQILGLYVAGVWMSIEIGDWVAEQFSLGPGLTAYLFVILGMMLPSVALLAWNHGAPGKDQWRQTERVFLPLNLVIAVGVAVLIAQAPEPPAPSLAEAPSAADEAAEREPAVPAASTQRLIAFFWRTELPDDLAWIGYALPYVISEDIDRSSPAFSTQTPFSSEATRAVISRSGYPDAMGEPIAVQIRVARDRQLGYFLRGRITGSEGGGDELTFTYALHAADTGRPVIEGSQVASADRLFDVADAIAADVRAFLAAQLGDNGPVVTDLPVAESLTGSLDALRAYTAGLMEHAFAKDFGAAAASIDAAIEADPKFAEALAFRSILSYLQGDTVAARKTIAEALRYADYKLSSESKYHLQMNDAFMRGEIEQAREIAVTWSEAEPLSEQAFMNVAEATVLMNGDLDEALAALRRVRELNPFAIDTWLGEAKIHRLRQDLDAATRALTSYIEARPDSVDAHVQLARVQMAENDYDAALETFGKARILDPNSLEPAIGQVQVQQRLGNFARAVDTIEQLKSRAESPMERIRVLQLEIDLAFLRGRYSQGIAALEEMDQIAQASMPVLLRQVQVRLPAIVSRAYRGDDPDAIIAELEAVRDELQPPWNDLVSYFQMQVYDATGQRQKYVEMLPDMERFFAAQPNPGMRPLMLSARAEAAIIRGETDEAATQVKQALDLLRSSFLQLEVTEDSFEIEAALYDQLRRAGEPERAIDGLQQIVSAYPSLGLAHLRLAQAQFSTGNVAAARASLDTVATLWSEADEGFVYLSEVDELRDRLTT
jgi:tetratricopeptide (TPR) repeat protein